MSEDKIIELEGRIRAIEDRNKRVEADKAWETSVARKLVVFVLTYIVIVLFMYFSNIPQSWVNAVVPAVAFVLSTWTVPVVKRWWVKKHETRDT
jgi:uncharacterized membrane-anchored protein